MSTQEFGSLSQRLTVNEVLDILEGADGDTEAVLYAVPPIDGMNTDEDSDASDDEHEGLLVHLGRGLLQSECEVQVRGNEENVAELESKIRAKEKTVSLTLPSSKKFRNASEKSASKQCIKPCSIFTQNVPDPSPFIAEDFSPVPSTSAISIPPVSCTEQPQQTRATNRVPCKPTSAPKKCLSKSKQLPEKTPNKDIPPEKSVHRSISEPTKWKKKKPSFPKPPVCKPKEPSNEAFMSTTPIDFFTLFFDDKIMNIILQETNRYAEQKEKSLNLSLNELYTFIGGLLLSGYSKCPNKRMYWSTEDDIPNLLQKNMRCNRFEDILRNFHFVDNAQESDDRLFKLRPILTHLKEKFLKHGFFEPKISIDESMIPYYGRHYAKQYIKGKPIRFGFKNWALCTSTGYMINFELYTGKGKDQNYSFGLGGDIVRRLLECIPAHSGYSVFFDNYFTSIKLMKQLHYDGYQSTGTIRENRTEHCPLPGKAQMKKLERGAHDYRSCDEVLCIQWKDNSVVTIATNFEEFKVGSTSRWSTQKNAKVPVERPVPFETYNSGMGGVDLMDQHVACYRTRMRQKKWWWPIFAYFLDVSVTNAWRIMQKIGPNSPEAKNLLNFRRSLTLTIMKKYGTPPQQGKRHTAPTKELRFGGMNHWPEHIETMRRCPQCSGKAKFICSKCDVGLHPRCFKSYHEDLPLDYSKD